ncbi:MAG: hypothetical protein V1748_10600 [Actinomycetota bacterium]
MGDVPFPLFTTLVLACTLLSLVVSLVFYLIGTKRDHVRNIDKAFDRSFRANKKGNENRVEFAKRMLLKLSALQKKRSRTLTQSLIVNCILSAVSLFWLVQSLARGYSLWVTGFFMSVIAAIWSSYLFLRCMQPWNECHDEAFRAHLVGIVEDGDTPSGEE